MECSVEIDTDCECLEMFKQNEVKARKTHRCGECGDIISPGDVYERSSGKCDGDFDTYKTCLTCVEIRSAIFCGTYIFGAIWDDIMDSDFELNNGHLLEFSGRAQMKLIEKFVLCEIND